MALFFLQILEKLIVKNYKEIEGTYNNQNNLEKKRTKLKESYFQISKLSRELQESRQCGNCTRINM